MGNIIEVEGTYRAKLTEKEFIQATVKGVAGEVLKVTSEVVTEGPQIGNTITDWMYFTEGAYPISVEKMRAMGWKGVDMADLSTLGSVEYDIVIQSETYQNKKRMKVKFVNAIGEAAAHVSKPLDSAAVKSFAARMRAKIVGLDAKQAKSTPAKAATSEEPPPPDDSDMIPNF